MVRAALLLGSKSGLTKSLSSGKVPQLSCEEVAIHLEQHERFFAPALTAGEVSLLPFSSSGFKLILSGSLWILFRGTCSLVVIRAGGS